MIDIENERILPVDEIPKHIQKVTGKRKRINKSTPYRWRTSGIAGVRLPVVIIGGTVYTSIEALNRFFVDSTAAKTRRNSTAIKEGIRRSKRTKQMEKEAAELGI